jgi:hypothetical protein
VFAGLVQATRYIGLLEASQAAHGRARHLDPTIPTSILHTWYMSGEYDRALAAAHLTSDPLEARVLAAMGRQDAAIIAARREEERFAAVPRLGAFSTALRAMLEGGDAAAAAALSTVETTMADGEGLFYVAEIYSRLGRIDRAFEVMARSIEHQFVCLRALDRSPYLDRLRSASAWPALRARAATAQRELAEAFTRRGGPAVLGLR